MTRFKAFKTFLVAGAFALVLCCTGAFAQRGGGGGRGGGGRGGGFAGGGFRGGGGFAGGGFRGGFGGAGFRGGFGGRYGYGFRGYGYPYFGWGFGWGYPYLGFGLWGWPYWGYPDCYYGYYACGPYAGYYGYGGGYGGYYGGGYGGYYGQGDVRISNSDHLKNYSVYVDNGYLGLANKEHKFPLTAGTHSIEVRDPKGQSIYQQQVQVVPGRTVDIFAGPPPHG